MRPSAFFGIAVTALALAWLGSRYDLADLIRSMAAADARLLVPAGLFLVLSFVLRAARWRLLFSNTAVPEWRNAFAALSAGYLFNNLLPSHAGELVRIFLLGRKESMPQSRVLGTVVLEKAFDLAVFVGLALLTVATRSVPEWLRQGAFTLVVLGVVGVAFMAFAPRLVVLAAALLAPLLDLLGASAAARVRRVLESLGAGLSALRDPRVFAWIVVFTVLIWASEIALLSMVVAAFALDIGVVDRLLVLIVIATGTLIPAAPGYVGTYEAFGVLAFDFLGQPHDLALASVVTLHAIQLAGTCLLGGIGLVWLRDSLGIRSVLQLAGKQAQGSQAHAAAAGSNDNATARRSPILVAVVLVWIVAMTAMYLVLSGPPGLIVRIEHWSPGFADLRAALASLFYRNYVY